MFAARHFRPFLPPPGHAELGEPWWIIPGELSVFTGYLSNNRFYPPPPKGKEVSADDGEPGALHRSPGTAAPCLHADPQCWVPHLPSCLPLDDPQPVC